MGALTRKSQKKSRFRGLAVTGVKAGNDSSGKPKKGDVIWVYRGGSRGNQRFEECTLFGGKVMHRRRSLSRGEGKISGPCGEKVCQATFVFPCNTAQKGQYERAGKERPENTQF